MNSLYENILLLKQSAFFGEVATEDLKAVAQALNEERFYRGERVFEAGDYGDNMYLIQQGKVGIALPASTKTEEPDFVCELGRGDSFGEMNLLDELPRSATACILEDAVLLSLEKSRLHGLIISYPALSLGMLKGLSLRLRQANARKANAHKANEKNRR